MTNPDHHGMKPLEGMNPYCSAQHYGDENFGDQRDDRFGRLFPELSPAYTRPDILQDIGKKGRPHGRQVQERSDRQRACGHDLLWAVRRSRHHFGCVHNGPQRLIALSTIPVKSQNLRSPTLDLDCIYGLGPEAQPYLFEQGGAFGGAKLLTGADNPGQAGIAEHDLLRAPNGRAIIGDPRNDENRIISQIQLAIIRFHNHVCDTLNAEEGLEGHDLYEAARETTTWHYQWALVNDFLTAICGEPVVERILGCGRQVYCGNVPFIPVEFSVAAYRFGHSMIPMKLQTRKGKARLELFGTTLGLGFDAVTDPLGVVDWHELLDTPENRKVERAQKLDTKLAGDLLALPFINPPDENSLATRNLLRGNTFLMPGGEKIAEAIGCDPKQIEKVIKKVAKIDPRIGADGIPLWLYLLAEAEVIGRAEPDGSTNEGEALGPVGATIVAEVMIGLLELDEHSYLGANRNWSPREEWKHARQTGDSRAATVASRVRG